MTRCLLKGIGGILLSVMLAMTMFVIPAPVQVHAESISSGLVQNGVLDGVKVRFRPAGSHKPISINQDGTGSQNVAHLYYNGHSSQFCLKKADNESYYVYFYQDYKNKDYKKSGDCVLDVERTKNDESYMKEGQVIHVTGFSSSDSAKNKRWKLIRQDDGTYYIQNVRSGLYWSLEDLSKPKTNNNKLIQRETPMKWEMEIVSGDNAKLKTIKDYDSMNFTYNGETVTSLNWMGALPGSLRITDISIPGTHDAGTCWLESDQGHSSDQRYYINELLNAGVRHLDLRTGLNDNKEVRVIHSSHECLNPDGEELSLDETMGWITGFLDANPTETVILQVKMDKEGAECEKRTYNYLKDMAMDNPSYIWAGDHVPTLKEVRGKIIIISRLDLNNLGGDAAGYNFKTTVEGRPALWGLDCSDWKKSEDYATDLVTSGEKNLECEVWTQDDFGHDASKKKKYIQASLLGSASIGKSPDDNSTLDRYNDAKKAGKHAWVFNYTSSSNGSSNPPFDICKEIHQWLYDRSEYNNPDRLVCGDTFTGVMCFDFIDELMAAFIYKTNFGRNTLGNKYLTIHGMSFDGNEVGKPLTLCVGESEQSSKLLNNTTDKIIKAYFNKAPYAMMTAGTGDVLTDVRAVQNQAELNNAAASAHTTLEGSVPKDLYVHLQTPIKEIDLDVNMPKCGTAVSADDPQTSVNTDGSSGYEGTAYITRSDGVAFAGTVEGGDIVPIKVTLNNKWGYRFDDSCTVTSRTATIKRAKVSGGSIEIEAEALIPHDAKAKEAQLVSCTSDGIMAHYECSSCKKLLLEKKASENDAPVLVEVTKEELTTSPALGHNWGKWEVTEEPNENKEGEKTRTCTREGCGATETLPIPKTGHVHSLTPVGAKPATCSSEGNIAYYKCSGCGLCFDKDGDDKRELTPRDIVISKTSHDWEVPVKITTFCIGETYYMTASMNCRNDASHVLSETVPAAAIITPATCESDGLIFVTGTFTNQTFGTQPVSTPVPALDHDWSDWEVTKEATCNEKGEKTQTCSRCGETKTEEIDIDPNAHITYVEIDETTDSATCDEAGRAMQYEVCSLCNKVVSSSRVDTEPLEHDWGKPAYKWSDDNTEATATRTCRRNGCHEEESETVQTTSRVLEDSSCETAGKAVYDAHFENEAFDTQEKVVEIAATGHQWDAGVITKPATATQSGVRTYTCTVCEEEKTEVIEPTGGGSGGGGTPGGDTSDDPVQKVIRMINDLPDPVTIKDADKVKAARAAYDSLSAEDKAKVSAVLLKKLTDAEEVINGGVDEDQRIADEASRIMAWIPMDETLATQVQVAAARAAYDALTDVQKSKIDPALVMRMLKAEYHLKTTAAETKEIKLTSAAARKGGKARITWKKQTGINGYQILCSPSKKFTKKTTKKYTAKAGLTSKVLKKLKPGKKYFVKVRAYTSVYDPIENQNVKVYSQYSNIKRFKAKK